jgi:putative transposase
MAQDKGSRFLAQVEEVLPREKILVWARELGVVRRQRKLDIVTFVYSLVLGFGTARSRSLSQFRRVYSRTCGIHLARSSFHGRFTEPLTHLMKRLLDLAISSSGKGSTRLGGAASAFLEVLAIDSSVVRVSEDMADDWPAAWSNHTKAAVKITAVTNVVGRNLKHVRFSPGSRHDIHLLKSGPWLRNRLVVFDLGFFKAEIFKEIDAAGGYFLSRLKKQSNPVILKAHTKGLKKTVGMKLKDAQALATGSVIDADALMSYIIKPLKHLHCTVPFRVVALYNERENTWHRYVTNAPPEKLSAENMTALYAARWEVELLFKELKSGYRLEDIATANPAANLCLIYSALLTMIISRRLQRVLGAAKTLRHRRLPHDRWWRLFATVANDVMDISLRPRRRQERIRELLEFLETEAPDPNRSRQLLAERASNGVSAFA